MAAESSAASYYGRDVLRLMGLERKMSDDGGQQGADSAKSSPSLMPRPPLLFPLEDEIFPSTADQFGGPELFVGREWLFKELHQQLVVEKAPLVLLMGGPGTGKSAILRQLVLNSHF